MAWLQFPRMTRRLCEVYSISDEDLVGLVDRLADSQPAARPIVTVQVVPKGFEIENREQEAIAG